MISEDDSKINFPNCLLKLDLNPDLCCSSSFLASFRSAGIDAVFTLCMNACFVTEGSLCRHGNRACMASVTRCTWVCPVCWTAGAWSAWSTWPWQMTRWRSCRPAPARCGTSRRTCRMFDCTVGGGSDSLFLSLILLLFLLASRFHSLPCTSYLFPGKLHL